MKNSQFQNRRIRPKTRSAIVIGLVAVAIYATLGLFGWYIPTILSRPIYYIAWPMWLGLDTFGQYLSGPGVAMDSKFALQKANADLMEQVRSLEWEIGSLKNKLADLQEIGQIFADAKFDLSRAPAVRIIKKPPSIPYDMIILGSGRSSGFSAGDIVVAEGDIAVGEILDVYNEISTAALYSSPGREISVLLGGKSLALTAQGRGGGLFQVQVPREFDLVEGEPVMIQSATPLYIGKVTAIYSEPTDPFKTAFFRLPINVYEIKWVKVATGDLELKAIEKDGLSLPQWPHASSTLATSTPPL
jgi:hypothetical protein